MNNYNHYHCRDKDLIKVDSAGLLSFLTFNWITDIMWKAHKNNLQEEELPLCSKHEMCLRNTQRYVEFKNKKINRKISRMYHHHDNNYGIDIKILVILSKVIIQFNFNTFIYNLIHSLLHSRHKYPLHSHSSFCQLFPPSNMTLRL